MAGSLTALSAHRFGRAREELQTAELLLKNANFRSSINRSYVTEGEVVSTFKAMVEKMFSGAATAKGALIITPEKVIVTTPGADNKKEL